MKTSCTVGLLITAFAAFAPTRLLADTFPIATTAQPEHAWAAAFDGTNFLVALQQDVDASGGIVGAKLVSPAGAVLATAFVQRSGDPPYVAFDGTKYLLAWADHDNSANGLVSAYGQFVGTNGTLLGGPIVLSQSTTVRELGGIAFDGTRFLVLWTDDRRAGNSPTPGDQDVYGRFVSTAGVPADNDFKLSDGAGKLARLAFGATGYLVIWNEDLLDTEVRARFVTPAGVLEPAFTVNASPAPSDSGHQVAFDGTNFLVVWGDEQSGGTGAAVDLFGQLVAPGASLVGGPFPIATGAGMQAAPFIAHDGRNYLVTWSDGANDVDGDLVCEAGEGTCVDIRGRFLGPSGMPGQSFVVSNDSGNQAESPVAYGADRLLVAWNHLFQTPNADVFGTILGASPLFRDGFESSVP